MVALGLPVMAGSTSPLVLAQKDPAKAAKEMLERLGLLLTMMMISDALMTDEWSFFRGSAALDDLVELKKAGKLWKE